MSPFGLIFIAGGKLTGYRKRAEKVVEAPWLFRLASESRDFANRQGLPLGLAADLRYAVETAMTVKPADFWIRRTGMLFFDRAGVVKWKDAVHGAMAELLGWSEAQGADYDREFTRLLREAVQP